MHLRNQKAADPADFEISYGIPVNFVVSLCRVIYEALQQPFLHSHRIGFSNDFQRAFVSSVLHHPYPSCKVRPDELTILQIEKAVKL